LAQVIFSLIHIKNNVTLTLLLLGLFLGVDAIGQEKKKIIIRKADRQEYRKQGNTDLFWLVGNVLYEHEGALMNCDSSIFYRTENRFNAFGNIRINMGDSMMLTGEEVRYNGNTNLLDVRKNVTLNDGTMQLSCQELIYDRTTNQAYYLTGGTLIQEENVMVSKRGYYNATTKLFNFRDSVEVTHPKYHISGDSLDYSANSQIAYFKGPTFLRNDSSNIYTERGQFDTKNDVALLYQNSIITKASQTITGDSIVYNMKQGAGEIFGHAYIRDTTNEYVITGDYAKYREEPEYALVTGRPLYSLRIAPDSLFITGDTLVVSTDENLKRKIRVFHNSRFYKPDFQGKSDSLVYYESDSTFHLYSKPVVWNAETQLTADIIFLTTKNGSLDSMIMLNNAFLIALEDSTKYNQIKGRNMYGTFIDNELRTIYVEGNGQTVYYAYDEADEEIGVNRADCSNLVIRIVDSRVERVTFLVKPKATLYPTGQIPQGELFLKGFNPRYKEQFKSKEDLFNYE